MSLALQLSSAGQFPQAEAQFGEAEQILAPTKERALKARLLHYRGIHKLNQKQPQEAEALLGSAQEAYTALVPPEALTREPVPRIPRNRFDVNGLGRVGATTGLRVGKTDPIIQGRRFWA